MMKTATSTAAICAPGFRLFKAETVPLTPELAEKFRSMEASPTERDLDEGRVKHLRAKADAGLLVSFHWSTAKLGDRELRMNGNHSSTMLTGLNSKFPEGLVVHLDHYQVDTEEALAQLFRQFDDRKSGRTPADVSGAFQGLHPEIRGVRKDIAKLGIDGIAWYRRFVEGVPVASDDGRYAMFSEEGLYPFLRWLGELFNVKTPELKQIPVVGAIYATFIKSETSARTFWGEVARGGIEYDEEAPQTALDGWLKGFVEDKKSKQDMKPGHFYQGCIYAWNAYRVKKTIPTIRWDVKKGLLQASE